MLVRRFLVYCRLPLSPVSGICQQCDQECPQCRAITSGRMAEDLVRWQAGQHLVERSLQCIGQRPDSPPGGAARQEDECDFIGVLDLRAVQQAVSFISTRRGSVESQLGAFLVTSHEGMAPRSTGTAQHTLGRSVVLHLLPGVPFTLAFFLLAPLLDRQGGSSYLALLICIPLFLLPVEIGLLVAARKKAGSNWEPLRIRSRGHGVGVGETALAVVALYLLVALVAVLLTPLDGFLAAGFSGLLPYWPSVDRLPENVSLLTLAFGFLVSGLAAPIVEELYFRAFLLPRIPVSQRWTPLFNVSLFAVYHFYAPWKYPTIFLAFLPMVYFYQLRGNLIAVIITHCLISSVGIAAAAAAIL